MTNSKFLFLPFGFWVFVLGLITLYLFYRLIRIYFWPSTEGIITKSGIKKDTKQIKYDYYYPEIEYSYKVRGKIYKSNKIFLTQIASDLKTIEKLVNQFPENRRVKVYYNPLNPKEAILKRDYHTGMFIQTLVFFGMLSVFLFTLIFDIIYSGADVSNLANLVKNLAHYVFYGE